MANDMGKKLRELRDARGLTQREVANAVGVTEATVSRWESGHINNMRRDKIESLAKVLQVSPLVIMGRDDESPAPPAAQPPSAPYHPELTKRDERDIMISASSLSPVLNEEEREHLRKYRSIDDAGRKIVDGTLDTVYRMRQDDTKPQ